MVEQISMTGVNKTLYIPLYGKALVSRRGLFIKDEDAERIWADASFPLKGKARSKWLAYYMGIRAAVFDKWVKERASENQDAVIIHIGAGLDSRFKRCGVENAWYDVDFPEVIEERRKYFTEGDGYGMIASDIRREGWLDEICESKTAIVVMEGVAMYLSNEERELLIARLGERFSSIYLLMDFYTPFGARMSKRRNPVNTVGVSEVWGIGVPESVGCGVFNEAVEKEMTPRCCIDELRGVEKFVFKTLYAGGISKKIYKLFEYKRT